MKLVDWQLNPNVPGGRGIEIPYIQRACQEARGLVIVDYGCVTDRGGIVRFATDDYLIHSSNTIFGVDFRAVKTSSSIRFIKADLCDADLPEPADISICVSVIEHLGTGRYDGVKGSNRDLLGLANIIRQMSRPRGRLHLTFPIGPKHEVINGWIGVYSPADVRFWERIFFGNSFTLELFKLVEGRWHTCEESDLDGVVHYAPGTDINAIGALTITWKM